MIRSLKKIIWKVVTRGITPMTSHVGVSPSARRSGLPRAGLAWWRRWVAYCGGGAGDTMTSPS
jgi:hypothetical protein